MTDPNWILAPGGRWTARDKVGDAAVGAFVFTYVNQTRTPKTTAQDPAGATLNPNPFQLDSSGEAQVYWATDELYTIEVWSVDPSNPTVPFELIYSEDNYPTVGAGSSGPITINQAFPNLIRNPQFTLWGFGFDQLTSDPYDTFIRLGAAHEEVSQDWYFIRSNSNATVILSKGNFLLGQTDVPNNPIHYMHYECTGIGAGGEVYKDLRQEFVSVSTLSNTQISCSFWARSPTSSNLGFSATQYFGSGGSPSAQVDTPIINASLTPDWQQFTATITVPSVSGKIVGTNNDDFFAVQFAYPLNAIANIDVCNVQMHASSALPDFAYLPYNNQRKITDYAVSQATFYTGDIKFSLRPSADDGWVACNDGTIGNSHSGANAYSGNAAVYLFAYLWNFPNSLVPIYNSDGSVGTRGTTAMNDWNADKRLSLTKHLGRTLAAAGTGAGLTAHDPASFIGAENTTLAANNLPPHSHESFGIGSSSGAASGPSNLGSPTGRTGDGSTLGLASTPFSNIQPTTYVYCYIKL